MLVLELKQLKKFISEQTAYEIDEEVRSLLNEARNKAAEIIQNNRETHKLIAEALLKYETLDSTQIKISLRNRKNA